MRHSTSAARLALTITFVLSIPAAVCAADQKVNLLLNGGVEKGKGELPSIWFSVCKSADGLRMWQCMANARTGKACLAISNHHQYEQLVSNNWAQDLQYVPSGRTIRLSAYIRTENADAANVSVQCWAKGGKRMLAFASTPVFRGTNDWTFVHGPVIVVPAETGSVIVRAALTGQGKAFFDDISLEVVDSQVLPPGNIELDKAVPGKVLRALPVTKDCMVLSYLPHWGYGELNNLAVANNDGGVRTLLAWPAISPKEAKQPNLKFLLALYSRKTTSKPPAGVIQAHELLEDWPERTSWEKLPRFSNKSVATFKFIPGDGWKLFDVTSFVRALAKDESKTHGVILRFTEENRSGDAQDWSGYNFVSREGLGKWENRRPLLLVVDSSQKATTRPASNRSSKSLLDYIEYLASLPDARVESIPGSADVYHDAMKKANLAATQEMGIMSPGAPGAFEAAQAAAVQYYEEYIERYPLTPDGIRMMNILGDVYARVLHRYDDARRILRAAIALAKNDSFVNILEINLAHVDMYAGELDEAEGRLRRIMTKSVPKSLDDFDAVAPMLFIAPKVLAEVFQKKGQADKAEQLLIETADRAFAMMKTNPEAKWIQSYMASAYAERISLILKTNSKNVAYAHKLAEEFKKRTPEYRGIFGYSVMIWSINTHKNRLGM